MNDNQSPEEDEIENPENAWVNSVITKSDNVKIGSLILIRDPVEQKLKTCKVNAVMKDIGRIAVTVMNSSKSEPPVQYALDYRCYVKYDVNLVGLTCTPHVKAECIPKSVQKDEYHFRYHLCLIILDNATELRFEAARVLPAMNVLHDSAENGIQLLCVFEIISGRIHYRTEKGLFNYDPAKASQQRRDLQLNYRGNRITFDPKTIWDDTVINELSESVKYVDPHGPIQSVDRILEVSKHNVSIIKFKNGESLLVRDSELSRDHSPIPQNTISNEDIHRRLKAFEQQIQENTIQIRQQQSTLVNNNDSIKRESHSSSTTKGNNGSIRKDPHHTTLFTPNSVLEIRLFQAIIH